MRTQERKQKVNDFIATTQFTHIIENSSDQCQNKHKTS
jgi:hypothetical protein